MKFKLVQYPYDREMGFKQIIIDFKPANNLGE